MIREQGRGMSASPQRQRKQKISPILEHAIPSKNAFASIQQEGRSHSDGIALHNNCFFQHQLPSMNLSYPPGNSSDNVRINAFLQHRLVEEQQRQEANMATLLDHSSIELSELQDHETKVFAPSPNPSIRPTYRQTVESKKQQQLDSLIQQGGTYSSSQIANIQRAGAPALLDLDRDNSTNTKNTTPKPNSPKKSLFNKIWPTTGSSLKPTSVTNTPTPEPTKTSTAPVPAKAAQILGTKDTTRRRTPSPPRNRDANENAFKGLSTPESRIDSEMFFRTPDHLLNLASPGARRGTPDQGLLLRERSGRVAKAAPVSSKLQKDLHDHDNPPTPPSKDRPRKPFKIKVQPNGDSSTSTREASSNGNHKPPVSTSAQLGEPSPVLGGSHQRQYPTILEVQAGPRSTYGHLDDTANLTPSPSAEPQQSDNPQRHNSDSAAHNMKKRDSQMTSPALKVIHPSSEMGGLGIIPATIYTPSVYSPRGWTRNDAWATPNLYPGPLHVPTHVHHVRTTGNSAGSSTRSRDMSNSTSATVPFFLEENNAQTSNGSEEHTTPDQAEGKVKTAAEALQTPHFACERALTPHRPSYETLTTEGTFRKTSDQASANSAGTDNSNLQNSQIQTHYEDDKTPTTSYGRDPYPLHSMLTGHFNGIANRLTTLESRLQDLSTHLCSLDTRFKGIDNRFDALGTGLETLDTYMASLDQRLAAVETAVTDHLPFANLTSTSESTNGRINTLEAKADKSIRLGETALKQLRSTSEYLANVKNDITSMNHNFVRFVKAQHEAASGARRASSEAHRSASSDKSGAIPAAIKQGWHAGLASSASSGNNVRNNGASTPSTANSSNSNYQAGSYMFGQGPQQSPQYQSGQRQQSPRHRQQSPQFQQQQSPQYDNDYRAQSPQLQMSPQSHDQPQVQPLPHSSPAGQPPAAQPLLTGGSLPTQAYDAYFTNLGRDRSVPSLDAHPAFRQTR